MSDERAGVLERMASALAGKGDAEIMGALGAAQVASGRMPAAHARQLAGVVHNGVGGMALITAIGRGLTALQAGVTQLSYDQARASMLALVKRLNLVRSWSLSDRNAQRVAEASLLMHLHPSCPHCRGRRFELIPETSIVSDTICRPCGGTGQRPYPRRFQQEIASTLSVLGLIQGLTEMAVAKELR